MSTSTSANVTPERPPSDPHHFGYIDALRGWAVLGVICVHASEAVGGLRGWPGQLVGFAGYGVPLFFVVSALTLCLSADARRNKDRRPLLAFFTRRLFRIAPMFWCAAIYYMAVSDFGRTTSDPDGIPTTTVALTAVFAHGWRPDQINAVVPGGWSIAVEMAFYLLFPVLFWAAKTPVRAAAVFAVCCVVSFAMADLPAQLFPDTPPKLLAEFRYYWLPSHLPDFAAGLLAYHLIRRPLTDAWPIALVFAAALALARSELVFEHTQFVVAFVLLAWGLSLRPILPLVNRVTRTIGVFSFSVYLVHFIFWGLACEALSIDFLPGQPAGRSWVGGWLGFPLADWSGLSTSMRFVILFAGITCLTLPVAAATHWLIERPGIAAGKWLLRRLGWSGEKPEGGQAPVKS